MREGLATGAGLSARHPLEHRLKGWSEQQERVKMEGLRRVFGIAEPVRRGMELKICGAVSSRAFLFLLLCAFRAFIMHIVQKRVW